MYAYKWDPDTGGLLLHSGEKASINDPRPVYYKELDLLGFDHLWDYEKNDAAPYLWAVTNNYYYRGTQVARIKGGSLYTPPEIQLLAEPEPDGQPLRPVDISAMTAKNQDLLEKLTDDAIQKIYNTYRQYQNKVDVFYVAFSGGKDSVVVMDLVQRALPHEDFEVIFADTDMEFPTTKDLVEIIKEYCGDREISFYTAKADLSSSESWDIFGAPARRLRWCCTVHKTAPVINKLCEVHNINKIHTMMITGVRADESPARSSYDEVSLGRKLPGQHSFHPILEWSSAEVYLYLMRQDLPMNEAYKLGFNRVGCIMCPNSSEKHEYIKRYNFPELVDFYCNKIVTNSRKDLSGDNAARFLETGGWKTRLSGRELKFSQDERFEYIEEKSNHKFIAIDLRPEWKIWYKTIGTIYEESIDHYLLEYDGVLRHCRLRNEDNRTIFEIDNLDKSNNSIYFIYYFKAILAKTQYCIHCMTCVAECPERNISMVNGQLSISDNCLHCHACLKIDNGCLYYDSVKGSKNMQSLKGINRYLSVGVDATWIKRFLKDQSFEPGNRKTDVMFGMMNDGGITHNKKLTDFGKFIQRQNLESTSTWGLILCNLVYTPAFGWYTHNIPFNEQYTESRLLLDMGEDSTKKDGGKKARSEFWNGFKTILDTNSAFIEMGFGIPEITSTANKNGEVKKTMMSITRIPWQNPDPVVILYSLYKFAEACGDYYQFTLTRLLNHEIDSDGVSPTEIFGLGREEMERILTGLSTNYPEFINASFTLGLDNITLRQDKTSQDVLALL